MRKYNAVFLLAAVWSGYYTAVKLINERMDSFAAGFAVRLIVFVMFTLILLWRGRLKEILLIRGIWKTLLLIGGFGFLLDITAFLGFRFSQSSATGTVLLKTDIFMVSILSVLMRKEKLKGTNWLLIFGLLAGTVMVMGFSPRDLRIEPGNLLFLLSALCISVNALLIQHLQRKGAGNDTIAYYNNLIAMLCFSAAALSGRGTGPDTIHWGWPLAAMLLAGGAGQLLIYLLYYKGLREHPAWVVKALLLLTPVFSLLTDALVFKIVPGVTEAVGTAMIILCAFLLIYSRRERGAVK